MSGQPPLFQRFDLLSRIASHPLTGRFDPATRRFAGTPSAFVDPASIAATLARLRAARHQRERQTRDLISRALGAASDDLASAAEEAFWTQLQSAAPAEAALAAEEAAWQARLEHGGRTDPASILPQIRQILADSWPAPAGAMASPSVSSPSHPDFRSDPTARPNLPSLPIFLNLLPGIAPSTPPDPEIWRGNSWWWFLATGDPCWLSAYASQATTLRPLFPLLREPILFPLPPR
ncbi:MAG: hypothetical protein OZSIB_3085 [Candidatus Ozemobacter sibiricus]|uniref:Uncharacterized protein n=1 Tax=Candidatus Ozemobacter sibiricus TaxID=2268124 RepID=A0A367ZGP0_9BACT|nr:MAG: hypothetical protein OZSIB_3085 [Candidatus Ozemobacter sibiricus]